jgi:predicted NUDIX family NTP pyrophosphohydrolase
MVFEGAASRSHNTQICRSRAVESQLVVFEVSHKLDAIINAIRLEGMEVESPSGFGRMRFTREVDELR